MGERAVKVMESVGVFSINFGSAELPAGMPAEQNLKSLAEGHSQKSRAESGARDRTPENVLLKQLVTK